MLLPRAFAGPPRPPPSNRPGQLPSNRPSKPSAAGQRPSLIVAVALEDVERFPAVEYTRLAARTTIEAVRLIGQVRPQLIVLDWDIPEFDHVAICGAAKQIAPVGMLVVMNGPERAPSALKAGCQAVLLKPLSLNLVAARLGRLSREMPAAAAASRLGTTLPPWGTNRTWPDEHCPSCSQAGAVSFEYSSHRRAWYACLACEHVWLGPRRE